MYRSIPSLSCLLFAVTLPRLAHAQVGGAEPAPPEVVTAPAALPDLGAEAEEPAQPPSTMPASEAEPSSEPALQTAPDPEPVPDPAPAPPEPADHAAEPAAEPPPPAPLEPATETAPEPERVPWMAQLTWDHSYGLTGFDRGAQQTFDPRYEWWIIAEGGYHLDPLTTLYVRQDFVLELTDSNTTTTAQELQLTDTVLEAWRTLYEARPFDAHQPLELSARAGIELPLSRASQASSIVLGTRARLQAVYNFERVLHGLRTRAWARYAYRWGGSDAVEAESAYTCVIANASASSSCTQLGRATVRHLIVLSADAELRFAPRWSVGALLWFDWSVTPRLPDQVITADGIDPLTLEDGSTNRSRNRRILNVWLSHQITPWFAARLHVMNTSPERDPRGELRAPLDPKDTTVGLMFTVLFDALYKAAAGYETTPGHVVGN